MGGDDYGVECECKCYTGKDGDAYAYVKKFNIGYIHFCPLFFTALDSDGQGSTFLHEMSHLFAKTTDAVPSSPPAPSDAQSAYWIQQAVPNTRSFLKLYVDAFATLFK